MSDPLVATPAPSASSQFKTHEEKLLPAINYGLYLIGLTHGLTIFIGLIVAYANRASAGPVMETHYTFQIRTFWLSIWWFLIGLVVFIAGIPLSVVLVGVPLVIVGGAIMGAVWIWFLVRCVMGIMYLAQGEAYPRPYTWLL